MGQLDTQTLDSCALGSNRYKLLWDSISMGLFQGLLSQLLLGGPQLLLPSTGPPNCSPNCWNVEITRNRTRKQ